jgi:hypothetical protein
MSAVAELAKDSVKRLTSCLMDLEAIGLGVPIDTWHEFADGLVARTIRIPAGVVLTGVKHKAEHLNVCFGDISVVTEQGVTKRMTGYHVLPSLPGIERAGLTHAETWWTTIHLNPGNERDLAKLEDALVFDADQLQARRFIKG